MAEALYDRYNANDSSVKSLEGTLDVTFKPLSAEAKEFFDELAEAPIIATIGAKRFVLLEYVVNEKTKAVTLLLEPC